MTARVPFDISIRSQFLRATRSKIVVQSSNLSPVGDHLHTPSGASNLRLSDPVAAKIAGKDNLSINVRGGEVRFWCNWRETTLHKRSPGAPTATAPCRRFEHPRHIKAILGSRVAPLGALRHRENASPKSRSPDRSRSSKLR
jgi:hypothetical protein